MCNKKCNTDLRGEITKELCIIVQVPFVKNRMRCPNGYSYPLTIIFPSQTQQNDTNSQLMAVPEIVHTQFTDLQKNRRMDTQNNIPKAKYGELL